MRLLARNARGGFQLTDELRDQQAPRYAILSHTWGSEEVSYQDLTNHTGENKQGYDKIRFCADRATIDDISYFWVDTCCIDKTSHAELSEAIISMFRWYQNATKCYVYLADVSIPPNLDPADKVTWELSFHNSTWFTRGWTLQELLAPTCVEFFSCEGVRFGDKNSLKDQIHHITKIPITALQGTALSRFGFRDRLTWAINRRTTREEDRAYSLLGIFEVQMTPRYGEGRTRAFDRLRRQIKKSQASLIAGEESIGNLESSRPSKRRNPGFMDGAEPSSTQAPRSNSDYIDENIKQTLIEQLYFPQIDERLTSLSPAQENTCRWFLAKTEYIAWRNVSQQPDKGGFLWIKGNPGTGKSTLMKLLFEEAKVESQNIASQITLSFFFLARGAMEEKSTMGLYRSLLHQLFKKASDLRDSLEWMTEDGARGIAQNGWHEQAMRQTLTRAILMLGDRILTIFVDALDECDRFQTAGMVSFLEELCEQANKSKVQLRICLSSRHYPTIFTKSAEVTLEDQDGHIEDIRLYIRSKLRLRTREAESLRLEILEKSSGIFLWVVLVLNILNREYPNSSVSITNIRNRLREIPPGLTDLFEMILRRDGENTQRLQICLQWILFAARPLKPQELYVAVELGLNPERPSLWDKDDVELDAMKTFVIVSSKGLAEVTRNKTSTVQFIHESVRDFLLDRYQEPWSGASGNVEGHCHDMLRNCCLAQVNDSIEQEVTIPDHAQRELQGAEGIEEDVLSKFPFFAYSVLHIFHHADLAQQHGVNQADFLAHFPRVRWVLLNNVLEKQPIPRYTESVSLLYILAEKNLANLIRIHPRVKSYLDAENERYGTPLFAALATDSRKAIESFADVQLDLQPERSLSPDVHMQFLQNMKSCPRLSRAFLFSRKKSVLSHIQRRHNEGLLGFFVNAGLSNAIARDGDGRDALSHAAQRGYENLVTMLLHSRSIDVESKDNSGRTPLRWAAEYGREKIVQQLLENGADVNSKDQQGRTPLSLAVWCGHEKIVHQLLERRADVNSKDRLGWTPLLRAINHGHENIGQQLLEIGVDAESKDKLGRTPISWAAQHGLETTMQQLLRLGVDADSKDDLGRTPFSWAAQHGQSTVVQQLLEIGVDAESKDKSGRTPLIWAAQSGQVTIVHRLLEIGIDPRSKDELGQTRLFHRGRVQVDARDDIRRTALGWAAKGGHEAIARLLLDRGAEPESRSANGCTSLSYAALGGHGAVVQLLLDTGRVNINAKDNAGRTPLACAARKGHIAVVGLLLGHDAEVDSKDTQGCTPLFHVASCTTFLSSNNHAVDFYRAQLMTNYHERQWPSTACLELYEKDGFAGLADRQEAEELVRPVVLSMETQEEIIKRLTKKGADFMLKNMFGETALSHAAKNDYQNVMWLLCTTGGV